MNGLFILLTVSVVAERVLNVFFMIYHRMSNGIDNMAIFFSKLLKEIFLKVFVRPLHIIGSTVCDNLAIKYAFSNRAKAVTTRVIWKCTEQFNCNL